MENTSPETAEVISHNIINIRTHEIMTLREVIFNRKKAEYESKLSTDKLLDLVELGNIALHPNHPHYIKRFNKYH